MTDFLLELRSEEIPARMQDKAREDLARLFAAELAKAGLAATETVTYATPRRLALIARGLPTETQAVSEELKGPKANAPEQALAGFLRKTGLTRDQLTERDGVLYAITEKPGRATAAVLAEAIPAIVRAFPWPKSMRWGAASASTESLRWVRPLHGIVALLGETLVDVEIAGIRSGVATYGHRFHHPGQITIGSSADYVEKLRACHVILDQDERRALIRDRATALAADAGLTLVEDEGLVAENAGLTEWPVPLLGRFDADFLSVPPEVIQLTARVNQKYFVCRSADGALANAFVCTANIEAIDGGAKIVEGNRKVLAARLSDARFFYDTDLKTPLEEQAAKLSNIVFHEKLGTVADKVDRVAKLARWLVEEGIVPPVDGVTKEHTAYLAGRAAELAKADLVTGMVGEFPELQGLMGGYYAAAQGEPREIADAIRDHYKPVGQGDDVPTAPVTVAVSLADKLDTIASFFSTGEKPTGSKDPFALRRAALGIISLLRQNQSRMSVVGVALHAIAPRLIAAQHESDRAPLIAALPKITELLSKESAPHFMLGIVQAVKAMPDPRKFNEKVFVEALTSAAEVRDFLLDRLEVMTRQEGGRFDIIRAAQIIDGDRGKEDDLVRLLARVHALQAFVTTDDGANLLAGYKRAANILKKEAYTPDTEGNPKTLSYTPEKAEADLIAALESAEPAAAAAVAAEDFERAMAALASLRAPIDAFFDSVTVNDADPAKRAARLALLARVRAAVHTVADFSKIEG
ncbi:glycine--tRNA ligase subunit beta [Sphingomonas melonis TY]|jgi:glycyl-tRNA synthetase beta chain|uniref:Glycine--tRNA ligase beta subunit n=1 Tax=Sphingomonas melonis TY TaxID=621456 RepID=A0A175Y218_9SPHN|nr:MULTISPECIES: glycine--tRNA ligase subunit beta [Sphingomonas]ATI57268.1 glycine--tRNA ligase subunit beta [Sphingomonas melonis]KZB94834.1 glycine--tRNA ligase subunit beta [Sphingomonas melonis TY]MBX8844881.1 glycine--tRNA ligase subunit beta [Sphingomonas melonis]MBX8853970.1 glycine--tRNA ligase subunit beta [Sphingomonas melonis]MBX8898989.1 glycine--tRNA ligase subunit beta [Sphingomonas melonis]